MKQIYRISIIGNSVALRTRPQEEGNSTNYGRLIENHLNASYCSKLTIVSNHSFSRATVIDVNKILIRNISNDISDIYIINLGLCDASPREIPYWYANLINTTEHSYIRNILKYFHDTFIKPRRSTFVNLRNKKPWISKKRFKKEFITLIDELRRNSSPKIIALSINRPDNRIEKLLPGSKVLIKEYSNIIEDLSNHMKFTFLNLDDLESKIHYPDGSHYSKEGHSIVSKRLLKLIEISA